MPLASSLRWRAGLLRNPIMGWLSSPNAPARHASPLQKLDVSGLRIAKPVSPCSPCSGKACLASPKPEHTLDLRGRSIPCRMETRRVLRLRGRSVRPIKGFFNNLELYSRLIVINKLMCQERRPTTSDLFYRIPFVLGHGLAMGRRGEAFAIQLGSPNSSILGKCFAPTRQCGLTMSDYSVDDRKPGARPAAFHAMGR